MEEYDIILIPQSWNWEYQPTGETLTRIEVAGRTCYKSEDKITETSAENFVKKLINRGHMSVIEHSFASIKIITSRGISHELVRHRLASYSQSSSRYINYKKKGIEIIIPEWIGRGREKNKQDLNKHRVNIWEKSIEESIRGYLNLLKTGLRPEDARGLLPIDLKTEIVISANLREWRHILKLRTSSGAHPQMKQLMKQVLAGFKQAIPCIFNDL